MKATTLLEKQHRKVEVIFEKLESAKGDVASLLTELANDLAAHMDIEQTIFYPAVREVNATLVGESYEEHALAELALKRLLAADPKSLTFKARLTALKELIEHHVEEEEEELFPAVQEALDGDRLNVLGEEMKARFDEALELGYEELLPADFATSADAAKEEFVSPRKKPSSRPKGTKSSSRS